MVGQGAGHRPPVEPDVLPPDHIVFAGHHGRPRRDSGGRATRRRGVGAAGGVAIPSRPRLARHRIEEARAYQLDGQAETALATLEKAHKAAPETIKYNGYARRIVLEEMESRVPARRQRAAALADQLGLLAA